MGLVECFSTQKKLCRSDLNQTLTPARIVTTETNITFHTVKDVFEACETAGMMTRTQCDMLGDISYWVDINHKDMSAPMTPFFSDKQLIGWANAFFNRDWDSIETEEEDYS